LKSKHLKGHILKIPVIPNFKNALFEFPNFRNIRGHNGVNLMRTQYMEKLLLLFAVILTVTACDKDEFETKPQIKIISVSNATLPRPSTGPTFSTFLLEFTDKEGDVDSSIVVARQRLNARSTTQVQSEKFIVPEFPDKRQGEIELTLSGTIHLSKNFTALRIPGTADQFEPDTIRVSFVLADKKGNRSDTASTTVYVLR
jgi:hypothetical protein